MKVLAMKKKINLTLLILLISTLCQVKAESLSPNGFSGMGVVPSAETIKSGNMLFGFDPTVPGKVLTKGYNTQIGFGLPYNLELVGRLSTNDQKCNMFRSGDCPSSTYRDFSSSVKWSLPIEWLSKHSSSIAIGATDFGGAATYFRSYYVLGTKTIKEFDLSLGHASAKVPTSMLDGTLAAINWRPNELANVSLQKVGKHSSAHVILQTPEIVNGVNAWVTLNRRLSGEQVTDKGWVGIGVSTQLDQVEKKSSTSKSKAQTDEHEEKAINQIRPSDLAAALKVRGFYNPKVGFKGKDDSLLIVELENTSYIWNTLDATGVALGAVASAYVSDVKEQKFELTITNRGIKQIRVKGEVNCVAVWLTKGKACDKLSVESLLQRSLNVNGYKLPAIYDWLSMDESVGWESGSAWQFRPEIILSPTLVSAIGTEYGAFDFDSGVNINTVLPLWSGATLETNRLEPLGVGTRQFELGGAFFGARLKSVTSRNLFHQLINLQAFNTQARLSLGTAYSNWNGRQIESSTQSENGRHKFGYTGGAFKNESLRSNNEKNYQLFNYRFVSNDQQTAVTEITQGKFWGGDKGFNINQRFWFGDTSLNVYFRRTRMGEGQPLVSFAGLQFAIPFTPRENKSLESFGFRGVSQWTYSLETKVLEKDNIITGGYGEVPRIGDSLVTTFNRDRNSTRYYDTNLARMRNAYLKLGSY